MPVSAGGPDARVGGPGLEARLCVAHRAIVVVMLCAAMCCAARRARAEDAPDAAAPDVSAPPDASNAIIAPTASSAGALADAKPEIGFSADELEGDLRVGELVLRGHVVINSERFRLTSPELRLVRTPRGIVVRGWGEVVFCPCPEPPVAIGFRGGLVAPPADLLLDRPELRLAGTTVAVLPWFWLRAPSRAGLLPPTIAWRGSDGLLLGLGGHFPWGDDTGDGSAKNELDVTAAGYLQGGFDLSLRVRTERSTNEVRWDHLHGDLLAVDAHGAEPFVDTGAVAWDVDAVRGSRARAGSLSLEEAARAYDRAAVETTFRPASMVLGGLGFRAEGARGDSGPSERYADGPRATLAAGDAIGEIGSWDALSTFAVLDDPWLGTTELGRLEGGTDWAARPSFLVTRLGLRESALAATTGAVSAVDAVGVAEVEVAAPLVRAFGAPQTAENPETARGADPTPSDDASPVGPSELPYLHVIEPRVRASIMSARTSGDYWSATGRPVALQAGTALAASVGARTSWGRWLSRSGGSLEVDVGELDTVDRGTAPEAMTVLRYRTSWSTQYFGWSGEGAARLTGQRGQVTIGRVRLGEEGGWHLGVKAAGRSGVEPIAARALAPSSASEPSGGWLAAEGWSAGADVRAQLGRALSASAAIDEDITSQTLLALRTSVGYAHPCRCVSVNAFAGQRLARGGVDVWVSIDLAPR
jgi:hypothetical protein